MRTTGRPLLLHHPGVFLGEVLFAAPPGLPDDSFFISTPEFQAETRSSG